MAFSSEMRHLVRGADGRLYAVSGRRCESLPAERHDVASTDRAAPRISADPGDHAAARIFIDPGDHAAARIFIDPGDHAAARIFIDPGDHVASGV